MTDTPDTPDNAAPSVDAMPDYQQAFLRRIDNAAPVFAALTDAERAAADARAIAARDAAKARQPRVRRESNFKTR